MKRTLWFGKPTRKPSPKYPDFVSEYRDPETKRRVKCGLWIGRDQVGLKLGGDVAFLDRTQAPSPFAAGSIEITKGGSRVRERVEADMHAVRIGEFGMSFRLDLWPKKATTHATEEDAG